jgi:endonuclease YncB( thermonuclease family)
MKYRMIGITIVSLVLILAGVTAYYFLAPRYITAENVGVKDGDSITITSDGKTENIRLLHIDAPEYDQSYGYQAKEYVRIFVQGKKVKIKHWNKRDPYGRLLAIVILEDGTVLNELLVQEGMAWWYKFFSKDKKYEKLESAARKVRRGLWLQNNPTPPWDWRRRGGPNNW